MMTFVFTLLSIYSKLKSSLFGDFDCGKQVNVVALMATVAVHSDGHSELGDTQKSKC